jgi:processive 1,2-diacylglycerol beta-glucosyltransferase
MSGGFGVGAIDQLAQRLLALPGDFQLVALAGRNAALLDQLRTLAAQHPGRLLPLGFTDTPERVMACADLAITKPGGLTTAECLALGLPLLVVSPIPGQEERNADHLLEHGAALKAHDAAGVVYRVRRWLEDAALRRRLAETAGRLGRPDAAARIAALAVP